MTVLYASICIQRNSCFLIKVFLFFAIGTDCDFAMQAKSLFLDMMKNNIYPVGTGEQ